MSRCLTISRRISFARSTIEVLLEERMLDISSTFNCEAAGPILSIVSRAAPIIALSTFSREDGISITPLTFPLLLSKLTSICPMRPERCSFLKSSASGINPSVCPKIAPMMSFLRAWPSSLTLTLIMYFALPDSFIFLSP